jgi:hypothetical protein
VRNPSGFYVWVAARWNGHYIAKCRAKSCTDAPRSMKVGNTRSHHAMMLEPAHAAVAENATAHDSALRFITMMRRARSGSVRSGLRSRAGPPQWRPYPNKRPICRDPDSSLIGQVRSPPAFQ